MFNEKEFYCENENCLMTIEGIDRFTFIQGIITNDIEKLRKKYFHIFWNSFASGQIFNRFFLSQVVMINFI